MMGRRLKTTYASPDDPIFRGGLEVFSVSRGPVTSAHGNEGSNSRPATPHNDDTVREPDESLDATSDE